MKRPKRIPRPEATALSAYARARIRQYTMAGGAEGIRERLSPKPLPTYRRR